MDYAVFIEEDRSLTIRIYRIPTHMDQYQLFNSLQPLEHKLGDIRTLQHQADKKEKEHHQLTDALKLDTLTGPFLKKATRSRKNMNHAGGEKKNRCNIIIIPYVSGLSEKLGKIFKKHLIPMFFKPHNTLIHKLVHPKDQRPHPQIAI